MAKLPERVVARRSLMTSERARLAPTERAEPVFTLSDAARRLFLLARKCDEANDKDDDVLEREQALARRWFAAQCAIGDRADRRVRAIPGIRVEPEFERALASLHVQRMLVYANRPFLFSDTEWLAWTIQNYARKMRLAHDSRERLMIARARLSVMDNPAEPGSADEVRLARSELRKAMRRVARVSSAPLGRRIAEARELMISAREGIERDFHITTCLPPEPSVFAPVAAEGTERKSDSNRPELKPRASPRV